MQYHFTYCIVILHITFQTEYYPHASIVHWALTQVM